MKVLFFARHYSYLRLFESTIVELARRGHEVRLCADREETMGGRQMVERLAARYPTITLATTPGRGPSAWMDVARRLRLGTDYLRFLDPAYDSTPHLRARARERAPGIVVSLTEGAAGTGRRARIGGLLRWLEHGVPLNDTLRAFIAREAPDVVLVTPLVELGSPQMDHLAAARAVGCRTALPVASWDHLSSKALIRETPDLVLVWNDIQRQEAITMHGVPPDRVVATGAHCYDQWFGRTPSRPRDEFCLRVGLDPTRPYILYLWSSLFRGTANETDFVERWVAAVRASADPRVREAGILIRPHPGRADESARLNLSGHANVAIWGEHPVHDEAKDDYFDSMAHSAAVVGLNTSAFLEAAIVGRPVHTVLLDDISTANQEGTIHFRYLMEVNGGLLHVARTFDEHVAQLRETLDAPPEMDAKARRFVEGFIRPFGLDTPATPRFVDALEALAARPSPRPITPGMAGALARLPLYPAVAATELELSVQPRITRQTAKIRKRSQNLSRRVFTKVKRIAQSHLGEKELAVTPPGPPSALTPKPGSLRDPAKKLAGTSRPEAEAVRELVTELGRSERPILLGPWFADVGAELLYWIPFLAWVRHTGALDPARLVVVSRGGTAAWYRHITSRYVDLYTVVAPADLARRTTGRGAGPDDGRADYDLVALAAKAAGVSDPLVLHPSTMYALFEAFWSRRVPITLVEAFTSFRPLDPPDLGDLRRHLPDRFVAARFYANPGMPDSAQNRAFAAAYLAEVSRDLDVVLLNTTDTFGDARDLATTVGPRVHLVSHLMTPDTSLDVQTRIIAASEGFVGTYGGLSFVAPFTGRPALTFQSHASTFRFDHFDVARRVFAGLTPGGMVRLDVRAADLLHTTLQTGDR